MTVFKIPRLAARIEELRCSPILFNEGLTIVSDTRHDDMGARYVRYRLVNA